MKKALLSFILVFFSLQGFSQLLSWTPDLIQEISTTVVSTVDAIIEAKHIIIAGNKVVEINKAGKFAKGSYPLTIIESQKYKVSKE